MARCEGILQEFWGLGNTDHLTLFLGIDSMSSVLARIAVPDGPFSPEIGREENEGKREMERAEEERQEVAAFMDEAEAGEGERWKPIFRIPVGISFSPEEQRKGRGRRRSCASDTFDGNFGERRLGSERDEQLAGELELSSDPFAVEDLLIAAIEPDEDSLAYD